MTYRTDVGWRAFSHSTKEADFGTAESIDANGRLYYEGEPADRKVHEFFSNKDEVNGTVGSQPDRFETLAYILEHQHVQRAMPHNVALFAALALGKITTTEVVGGSVYQHRMEIPTLGSAVELDSVTMLEYNGLEYNKFAGIVCSDIALEMGAGPTHVRLTAGIKGCGKREAWSDTTPTCIAESYLTHGDVKLYRGGSVLDSGASASGGDALHAKLISCNYSFANGARPHFEPGHDSPTLVSRFERDAIEQTLSCVLEVTTDQEHQTALTNGTEYVLYIPITGGQIGATGYYYYIHLVFPRVVYKDAVAGATDRKLTRACEFEILKDSSYDSSVYITCQNAQATYLG